MSRRLTRKERKVVARATEIAAHHFHLFRPMIFMPTRCEVDVATARQVALYLAHVVGQVPINRLTLAFKRDLSSITHNIRLIEDRREPGSLGDAEITYLELKFRERDRARKQARAA